MLLKEYQSVDIHLISAQRAILKCPQQRDYSGDVSIDEKVLCRLLELEHERDFRGYGKALFEAVFPPESELRRGIYSLLDSSRKEQKRLRLRLEIDPASTSLNGLHWELLTDGSELAFGRSPETVFSRYVSRPHVISPPPTRPRMLCVIAAPIDIERYGMAQIYYDEALRRFDELFMDLRDELQVDFLHRPVSPERLREQLVGQTYHLLHIHGHGVLPRRGEAALVLEDRMHRVRLTTESALRGILLGLRDLKLVTLVGCHGGSPSKSADGLSGLAGSLVKQNVPAVIGMRRAISIKLALSFTQYFYRSFVTSPCVDEAMNEARQHLFLADPGLIDWSSPILYMRLEDGLLWKPNRPDLSAGADRGTKHGGSAGEEVPGGGDQPSTKNDISGARSIIRTTEGHLFLGNVGTVNDYRKK